MLKRSNRLTSKFQFNTTRKYGRKLQFDCFNLYYLQPRNYEGKTQVGIVVANTISKLATTRNRIKRQLREGIRPHIKTLPQNLWIAVYASPSILKKNYEEISSSVNKAIQEISISN